MKENHSALRARRGKNIKPQGTSLMAVFWAQVWVQCQGTNATPCQSCAKGHAGLAQIRPTLNNHRWRLCFLATKNQKGMSVCPKKSGCRKIIPTFFTTWNSQKFVDTFFQSVKKLLSLSNHQPRFPINKGIWPSPKIQIVSSKKKSVTFYFLRMKPFKILHLFRGWMSTWNEKNTVVSLNWRISRILVGSSTWWL